MLINSALASSGLCTCSVLSAFAAKSDCCNTPDLEPESYSINDECIEIDLSKAASLDKAGHAAFISDPDRQIELIIVRPEKDRFVALTRLCTHGRQVLSYNAQRQLLQCNSYNHSLFDLQGQVWKGHAPRALDSFEVKKNGDRLTVILEKS